MHDLFLRVFFVLFSQNFYLSFFQITAISLLKEEIVLKPLIMVLDFAVLQSSGPI